MPVYRNEDDRRRIVDQLELMREEHGDRVAWDTDRPEDFNYLYDPDVLLVRTDVPGITADTVVDTLAGNGFEGAEVREFPSDDSGRDPLALVHVVLPATGSVEEDRGRASRAVRSLDSAGLNDTAHVAELDYWLYLCPPVGNGRICPATEPQETGLTEPWPGVAVNRNLGQGVRVSVVDSGWHAPSAQLAPTSDWLGGGGVKGDAEPYGPAPASAPGPALGPYAGHGTFIAGVVRCLAPSADVYVERFLNGGSAILESEMVRQLRQTLNRQPHIINLSAGATTREMVEGEPPRHRLLSFEVFWEQDLSREENCVLVAAAGNDSTDLSFWPASFDWAVGVGSLDRDGRVSDFSNYGDSADVYALGRNIVNAYPNGTFVCRETPDKGDVRVFRTAMARWSGTSFAAPVVAGLLAAEVTGGGNVRAAWSAMLGRAGEADPDPNAGDVAVPAFFPPYT